MPTNRCGNLALIETEGFYYGAERGQHDPIVFQQQVFEPVSMSVEKKNCEC